MVGRVGGASVGDRTLIDALVPFVDAFPEGAPTLADAWETALPPMRDAVTATAQLVPRKGRAATHGSHALGTIDAGARSLGLALDAIGTALRTMGRSGEGTR